jgi:ribosomal protein S18 acetylase RimI-like enzyme
MTPAYAADIATWRYPPPYDCYDMAAADPAFLTDPANGFFALVGAPGELAERGFSGECGQPGAPGHPDGVQLIGFRSFGADGQVPGGVYDSSALDTGGGLRPELTGRGLGREAIRTGLDFGRRRYAPPAFRVTIAAFNVRAQRVVVALGFRKTGSFQGSADGRSYEVLVRPEHNDIRA